MSRVHCWHRIANDYGGHDRYKCCWCGTVKQVYYDMVTTPGHGEYAYREVWIYLDARRDPMNQPYFMAGRVDVYEDVDLQVMPECVERDITGDEPSLGGDKRGR